LNQAGLELARLKEKALAETGASEAQIFEAHALFLEDPALISVTEEGIRNEIINVERSWQNAIHESSEDSEGVERILDEGYGWCGISIQACGNEMSFRRVKRNRRS